jgi:hypothetical protein
MELVKSIHECDKNKDFICYLPPRGFQEESIMETIQYYQQMEGRFEYLRVKYIIDLY